MIFLFKVINARIDCPDLLNAIPFNAPVRHSRSALLFYTEVHRTNYACNNSINRILNSANNYCQELNFFDTSNRKFINELRKIL